MIRWQFKDCLELSRSTQLVAKENVYDVVKVTVVDNGGIVLGTLHQQTDDKKSLVFMVIMMELKMGLDLD